MKGVASAPGRGGGRGQNVKGEHRPRRGTHVCQDVLENRFKKKVDEVAEDGQKGEFVVEISVPRERIASYLMRHKHSRHLSVCSVNECMCNFERP